MFEVEGTFEMAGAYFVGVEATPQSACGAPLRLLNLTSTYILHKSPADIVKRVVFWLSYQLGER